MSKRTTAPSGAPCWADLWTSDVEAARAFYAGLFGWEPGEADAAHGGYFMFFLEGAPVAGAMGPMGDMPATDTWKPYLASADIALTLAKVVENGGSVLQGAIPIDTLGIQALVADPTGAEVGIWQPIEFQGFSVLDEDGTPSWFELHTAEHARAVSFYKETFDLEFSTEADSDDFRYSTFHARGDESALGGIMDSRASVAPGRAAWSIYWEVGDVGASLERASELGGKVLRGPDETPWGQLGHAADPSGAEFELRAAPKRA